MSEISKSDILSLSVPERIQLAEDIWDSVTEVPESIQLTGPETEELERRLRAYHEDPNVGSPWESVKQRLRSRT
jgi:putative addiction module component (TIGR02574 family)